MVFPPMAGGTWPAVICTQYSITKTTPLPRGKNDAERGKRIPFSVKKGRESGRKFGESSKKEKAQKNRKTRLDKK